jgi:hypothetical protein
VQRGVRTTRTIAAAVSGRLPQVECLAARTFADLRRCPGKAKPGHPMPLDPYESAERPGDEKLLQLALGLADRDLPHRAVGRSWISGSALCRFSAFRRDRAMIVSTCSRRTRSYRARASSTPNVVVVPGRSGETTYSRTFAGPTACRRWPCRSVRLAGQTGVPRDRSSASRGLLEICAPSRSRVTTDRTGLAMSRTPPLVKASSIFIPLGHRTIPVRAVPGCGIRS